MNILLFINHVKVYFLRIPKQLIKFQEFRNVIKFYILENFKIGFYDLKENLIKRTAVQQNTINYKENFIPNKTLIDINFELTVILPRFSYFH